MGSLHILRTPGYYLGQVRMRGFRKWHDVTGQCKSAEKALSRAVAKMGREDKRARVLFIPTGETGQWYEPHIAMEAERK